MPSKIIAVNTRFLLKDKLEGIGWFTYETLRRMTQSHPEIQFHFFFDRAFDPSFIFSDNIIPHVIPPPARHPWLWYAWFEWSLPYMLNKVKADLFLSHDGHMSLSTKVPTHLVIHDLAFEHYPQFVGKNAAHYYRKYTPQFARAAKSIATVSEYSKQDISNLYQIDAHKIDVVYNGVNESYKALDDASKQLVKAKYSNACDYFLYVGSIHPRKNVKHLFLAFDQFKKKQNCPVKLLIAGRKAWMFQDIEATYEAMEFKQDVIFLGHLLPDELAKVIASAHTLLYPSVFEGFGIPIIEAMNCDVPVITSNTSSMPEVAGDAGILIDPNKPEEIADAMLKMYADSSFRMSLIEKGRIQRQQFSWDKTAMKLWSSVERCL